MTPRRRLHVETLEPRETPAALVVNTLADAVAGDDLLSLREAVDAVNAGSSAGLDAGALAQITGAFGADEITFDTTGTIALSGAPLTLNTGVTITGPGAAQLRIDGNALSRVFEIGAESEATLSGLAIANGRVDGSGAGVFNDGVATITDCVFTENTTFVSEGTPRGTALFNTEDSTLFVTRCEFFANPGVLGTVANDGTATIDDSLFRDTTTTDAGGLQNDGTAVVTNTTFSGLRATNAVGAVRNAGTLQLVNCTVTNNSAGGADTTGGIQSDGSTILINTIVAGNASAGGFNNLRGTFDTANSTNNLIGTGDPAGFVNGTNANVVGETQPLLAPLGDYGGPLRTHALLPGSPALDAGSDADAPTLDARGLARVGTADIGAFESRGFTLTLAGGNNQSRVVGQPFALPLSATVAANGQGEPVDGGVVTFTPPASGASAALATPTATVANGVAQTTATANATPGTYAVTAATRGAPQTATYNLTNLTGANVSGTMTATVGDGVSYTVVLTNTGDTAQADNAGNEFALVLPTGVVLAQVLATSGTPGDNSTNTARWDGGIPAGGAVTITINCTFTAPAGTVISAQGTIGFDADGNGSNESTALTDDPATEPRPDPTVFVVPPPALSITGVTLAEGDNGTTAFSFTVILAYASTQTVTVNAATADGTAAAGTDYVGGTQTVTFLPGFTTQTVTVLVNGDTTGEPDETFTVTLSDPVGATIGSATNTGTITNDDPPPIQPPPFVPLTAAGAGGAPGSQPAVKVYNADGSERFSFLAYAPAFVGGARVATGDVTGDGVDDIITGAGPLGSSHVKVFDGNTGAEVLSIFAFDEFARFGVFVAAADLDGDGRAELIAGAGQGGAPHVKVFDGNTGRERLSFFAFDASRRGGVTVAGSPGRVVTGSGIGAPPEVRVFDSTTAKQVLSFAPYVSFAGGVGVATVGDRIVTGAGPGGGPHVKVFDATGAEQASIFAFDRGFPGGVNVGGRGEEGQLLVGSGPLGGPEVVSFTSDGARVGSVVAFDPAFLGGVFVG